MSKIQIKNRSTQHAEINELDAKISSAVHKRDFAGAAALQTELDAILKRINARRDLEAAIKEAVAKRDFVAAAQHQAEIDKMQSGKKIEVETYSAIRKFRSFY